MPPDPLPRPTSPADGAPADAPTPPGALLTWARSATGLDDFRLWQNTEHLPERVALPGVRRARRFRSLAEPGAFFSLYELASVAVLASDAYRAVVETPSPWTQRILALPSDGARRAIGAIRFAVERGTGGLAAVWRFDTLPDSAARVATLRDTVLPAFATHPAFAALRLIETDGPASGVGSASLAVLHRIEIPALVVVAEGWTAEAAFRDACAGLTGRLPFATPPAPAFYALEALIEPPRAGTTA